MKGRALEKEDRARAARSQAEPKEPSRSRVLKHFRAKFRAAAPSRQDRPACMGPANPLLGLRFAQETTTSNGARTLNRAPGPAARQTPRNRAAVSQSSARLPPRRDFPKRFRPIFFPSFCDARRAPENRPAALVARPRRGLGKEARPKKARALRLETKVSGIEYRLNENQSRLRLSRSPCPTWGLAKRPTQRATLRKEQ